MFYFDYGDNFSRLRQKRPIWYLSLPKWVLILVWVGYKMAEEQAAANAYIKYALKNSYSYMLSFHTLAYFF